MVNVKNIENIHFLDEVIYVTKISHLIKVFPRYSTPKKPGPGEKKGHLNTGVNRILILAHGQGWSETHNNLRSIVELLNLEDIKFSLAADLKLLNVLLGLSSHSGTHACLFCEGAMTLEPGVLRTFASIIINSAEYIAAGSKKSTMAQYKNCIKPCLLTVPDPSVQVTQYTLFTSPCNVNAFKIPSREMFFFP